MQFTYPKILSLLLLIMMIAGCDGGSEGSTKVSINGSITYLNSPVGTLQLRNTTTGQALELSEGETSFEFKAEVNTDYHIEVVGYAINGVSLGYSCRVDGDSAGTVSTELAPNLEVVCGRNISLRALQGSVSDEGVFTFLFQSQDASTGKPIQTLDNGTSDVLSSLSGNDYNFTEFNDSGVDIGIGTESFYAITPRDTLRVELLTVLSIDNSTSISVDDLPLMKNAALSLVSDDFITDNDDIDCTVNNPISNLLPEQKISIHTFNSSVFSNNNFTDNLKDLCEQIDAIALGGGTTTRAFDAIEAGLDVIRTRFTLSSITLGYLVLITDGRDESVSGIAAEERIEDIKKLRDDGEKLIYAIGVGDGVDEGQLKEFGNPEVGGGYARLDNYSQVQAELKASFNTLEALANSYSYIEYATGKRSGSYQVELSVQNNVFKGFGYSLGADYIAKSEWGDGALPTLEVVGGRNLRVGETLELLATVRYSIDTDPDFLWEGNTNPAVVGLPDGSNADAKVLVSGLDAGQTELTVSSTTFDQGPSVRQSPNSFILYVSDVSTNLPSELMHGETLEITATSDSTETFNWVIMENDTNRCSLNGSSSVDNKQQVILAAAENTGQAGSCTIRIYGNEGYYEQTVIVGNPDSQVVSSFREKVSEETLNERYQDVDDGRVVIDIETGLEWQRCSVGQTWTGGTCSGGATTMNWDVAMEQGSNGWRLPTESELRTIIYCSNTYEYNPNGRFDSCGSRDTYEIPTINGAFFPTTESDCYWTATNRNSLNSDDAMLVCFQDGSSGVTFKRYSGYTARLVRQRPVNQAAKRQWF